MLSSVKTKPLEKSRIHAQHFKRLPELVIAFSLKHQYPKIKLSMNISMQTVTVSVIPYIVGNS